jgi:hypothetical protein
MAEQGVSLLDELGSMADSEIAVGSSAEAAAARRRIPPCRASHSGDRLRARRRDRRRRQPACIPRAGRKTSARWSCVETGWTVIPGDFRAEETLACDANVGTAATS